MKIWQGYGSEHSMNLVLIGRFKTAREAENTERLVERLAEQARKEDNFDAFDNPDADQRFSDGMRAILTAGNIYSVHPAELEQFSYDKNLSRKDDILTVTTDEADVSAFIKVFVDQGARVEVFSAHDYPDTSDEADDTRA